ncbi:MAG: TRAP transporter small permease [Syntrophaceae bacterium]|nr:TRAP transporter small permease [Syntrophaceae bacterium]
MSALARLNEWLARAAEAALVGFMAVIAVIVPYEVFGRYVLGEMPAWSGEAATFALVWVTMMGGAAGLRRGYRIGITVLYEKLTPGAARAVRVVADLLVLGFFLVMAVYGLQQTLINIRQTSPAMELPMAFPYAALPIGFVLMFLFTLEETIRILQGAPREG